MSIDLSRYHGWEGKRVSPWWIAVSLSRTALLQVLRQKGYWVILSLGLLNFLFFFALIYAVTQFELPPRFSKDILKRVGFTAEPQEQGSNGYLEFMDMQGKVTMLLLAFSGSLLVGADFRQGVLAFYLSRGITQFHYLVGKVIAVGALIWLLTVVPAIVLFIEYGFFTSSTDYWLDNLSVVGGIVGYGTLLGLVLGSLLAAVSAGLLRPAPIAIVWCCLFLLAAVASDQLVKWWDEPRWILLNLWRDIKIVSLFCFDDMTKHPLRPLVPEATFILSVVVLGSWWYLARRIRAVETLS